MSGRTVDGQRTICKLISTDFNRSIPKALAIEAGARRATSAAVVHFFAVSVQLPFNALARKTAFSVSGNRE